MSETVEPRRELLTLDELTARIAMLRDEIARVEAAIAAKRESAAAADKFFRR